MERLTREERNLIAKYDKLLLDEEGLYANIYLESNYHSEYTSEGTAGSYNPSEEVSETYNGNSEQVKQVRELLSNGDLESVLSPQENRFFKLAYSDSCWINSNGNFKFDYQTIINEMNITKNNAYYLKCNIDKKIEKLKKQLKEKQQLKDLIMLGYTQKEIANELQITQSAVSKKLKKFKLK